MGVKLCLHIKLKSQSGVFKSVVLRWEVYTKVLSEKPKASFCLESFEVKKEDKKNFLDSYITIYSP